MPTTPLLFVLSLAAPQQQAPATAPADTFAAVRATNELGVALYKALDKEQPGKNLFLSPLSITTTLAMLTEGAREETAAELRRALHLDANTLADVHAGFRALFVRYRDAAGEIDPATRKRVNALREELALAKAAAERGRGEADNWSSLTRARRRVSLEAQLQELLPRGDHYEVRVANALWAVRACPLAPAFTQTLERFYGTGDVNIVGFHGDAEAARQRINSWAEEHTERRIKDLIPSGGVDGATRLVIGNAVFFRGEWAQAFAESATDDADFRCAGGGRALAKQMRNDAPVAVPYAAFTGEGGAFETPMEVPADETKRPATYPGDDGFTMVEMPYKGGDVAMLVLAPRSPDGLPRLERLLTATALASWTRELRSRAVDVGMLRFEKRSSFDLAHALRAAGVRRLFVRGDAQLGGIAEDADPTHALFVASVHHQAWLQVEERGTAAAAATAPRVRGIESDDPGRMVPFVPVFRADRPFLFLIRDVKSGAILFLGRVTDPRT